MSKPLQGHHLKKPIVGDLSVWPRKRYMKTSTISEMSSWEHKIMKPQMNASLFECSWVSATFSSINNSFSKMDRGKRSRTFLKNVGYKKHNGPIESDDSSQHIGSTSLHSTTFTKLLCFLLKQHPAFLNSLILNESKRSL